MCGKCYLVISGVVFALVAIGHLVRLLQHLPVLFGEWAVPMWASWGGMVVAATLCVWAFCLLFCRKCQ